ncbi:MAG: endonuclease, partial [Pelagerythrobacter marensis]
MQLTFASYNIHKAVGLDRRRDPDRILAVLREVDADIIALQEVDMRLGERASVLPRAALDDTPWRAIAVNRRPRSLGWHGNALLVRRGIEVV